MGTLGVLAFQRLLPGQGLGLACPSGFKLGLQLALLCRLGGFQRLGVLRQLGSVFLFHASDSGLVTRGGLQRSLLRGTLVSQQPLHFLS